MNKMISNNAVLDSMLKVWVDILSIYNIYPDINIIIVREIQKIWLTDAYPAWLYCHIIDTHV